MDPDTTESATAVRPGGDVIDDLGLSPVALAVLSERYLLRDDSGSLRETPGQMMDRVAVAVAHAEDDYRPGASHGYAERFATVLRAREFLPNSPTLMNAGTSLGVLSGCYVLPIEDSLESIFDTLRTTALLHRAGAGTGFSFSRLRRRGSATSGGGVASGPVSFIELYDAASQVIRLGGRRRGANMAVLDVHHPDIEEFLRAKSDTGALPTFNLSVGVTDDFLHAAAQGRSHRLIDPATGRLVRELPARELFAQIAENAWRTGEPGLLFLDTVNRANPVPELGRLQATNPCGEVPLSAFESCTLGSVNLARFLDGDGLDEVRLAEVVRLGVRFLDDVLDVSVHPVPALAEAARATRKIGLGVMGVAEMLAALGLPYDSPAAVRYVSGLMARISRWAHAASRELAAERGPFPLYPHSRWVTSAPMRNAQVTSIAPTGTISLIAGTSAGIEPFYAIAYTRHVLGRDFDHFEPLLRERARAHGAWSPTLEAEISASGTVSDCAGLPESLRRSFVTAHEIDPRWHIRMQAAVQRHTDAAVAKTINLPATADVATMREVFRQAWQAGVKGITVYRDDTRPEQVLRCPESCGLENGLVNPTAQEFS
ncbi:adenosylcobalamin-dependent ribonucleoside-diphosphate reductase [Nocardia terrae]|nr:adenosylcobalamin-dependent ribonucleoside-diphosphate reductase [Nocardia terrae]